MGSGKTTLGKKLAPLFEFNFVDLDAYMEEREQRDISTIFEKEGEKKFRQLEARYLRKLLNDLPPCVISLGGGTVCFENNLDFLKQNGLLVYIDLPVSVLSDRLAQAKHPRPLFKNVSEQQLPIKIKELLEQRVVYYRQAQLTVKGLNLTPKHLHQQIVEFLQK